MKLILATLAFYASNPGIQSFNPKCRRTVRAIDALEKSGFLRVFRDTNQATFTGKVHENY